MSINHELSSLTKKSCVVIGGGFAGTSVAKELIKKGLAVTIVQANDFTEVPFFSAYFVSRPELWKSSVNTKQSSVATLDQVALKDVKYVIGTVKSVKDKTVLLSDGRKVAFDALVVASGIYYPTITAEAGEDFVTRSAFVQSLPKKINNAKSILIGGAGPVALEVASELRRMNPNCKIQIVTSGENALSTWNGTPAQKIADRLKKTNIDVITNARININVTEGTAGTQATYDKADYTLSTGQVINDVDIFIPYFGLARTSFLNDNMVDKANRGMVKANMQGQSTEQDDIFTVGCGTQYPVIVQPNMEKEAVVVASNINDFFNGKKLSATLPDVGAMPDLIYCHLGLGQFTAMNLEQQGMGPGLFAWCCGCLNPFMPCCACCGWPCSYPASECQGKCMEKMLLNMGHPLDLHPPTPPVMADISR